MSGGLPANIDLLRLADQGTHLSGVIPLRRMKRLLTLCGSDEGVVSVELAFSRDRARDMRMMRGEMATEIATTCGRCLQPMTLALKSRINFLVTSPGQKSLEGQDGVIMARGPVSLTELVENELILVMPMYPKHELDQCPAKDVVGGSDAQRSAPEPGPSDSGKASPFAELAKLKRSDRK
ncbi:MAG: YceD family protein [Acidiferrobacterales bacterium]